MGDARSRSCLVAPALAVLGWASPGLAAPLAPPATRPPLEDVAAHATPALRVFNDKDGLPQNTVAAQAFDATGRLWVGTQDGLAVYDGRGFHRVPLPDSAKSEWVTAIVVLPDGTLVAGTHADGVWLSKDGRFEHVTAASGLPDDAISSLASVPTDDASDGHALWVGTAHGLGRRVDGKWSTLAPSEAPIVREAINAIVVAPGHPPSVWIGASTGVAVWSAGAWRTYRGGENGLPSTHVANLLVEATGDGAPSVVASMRQAGLALLEGDHWRVVSSKEGLPCDDVGPVARIKGTLWVGTICGGLARLGPGGARIATLDTRDSAMPNDLVRSILPSLPDQGPPSLWVGTETGGLARVALGGWRALTAKGSPVRAAVYAFGWSYAEDGALLTWIGTEAGLERHDGRTWSEVALPGIAKDEAYVNAVLDARGPPQRGLWVATFGGAARLRDGEWKVFSEASGLPSKIVLTLYEATGEGGALELLAGMRSGLARFDGERWSPVTEPGAPTREEVTSMVETAGPSGNRVLWVATAAAGIFRREGSRWTHLAMRESPIPCNEVLQVQRVHVRGDRERLFVSTGEAGLAWFDPTQESPTWFTLTTKTTPAIPDQVVYGIQQDARGRVYAFTNHGVARLVPRAEADSFDVDLFTTEDGLPSNECNTGGSAVDPLGRVWAGTVAGAAVLDAGDEGEDRVPKRLLLEGTMLFGEPFDLAKHPELSHDQDTLSFEMALLSFHREGDTRYRSQLVGLEREPSAWTPDAKVRYTSLRAGSYELRAWGRDYAGNVSGPITVPFRVRPAPWNTWWAWAAYLAAAASLVTLGVRGRVASLKKRAQELSDRVTERTTELAARNVELAASIKELDRKNVALLESHQRADRIFSAFAEVLPGSVLDGKYRVEQKIGSGGFGAVFRAQQLSLDRQVAVKIFRPQAGNDSALALERFQREGMSACRVNHPNAIQVFDSGLSSEGIPYIVMELLEGRSLASAIRREGGLTLRRVLSIATPVCEALAAAHEAGLVHRDIKPDNVFLHRSKETRYTETVKLLDFGIAKLMEQDEDDAASATASAAFVGTPRYMAPERLMRAAYGDRSDVYSVGVLLYEMIAGRAPWEKTRDLFGLIAKIVSGDVVPLHALGVPAALSRVVMRALGTEPSTRPSAAELARDLTAAQRAMLDVELDAVYGRPEPSPEESGPLADDTKRDGSMVPPNSPSVSPAAHTVEAPKPTET